MKKETLLEIILGTIGGLIFAVGMCMCLIPEWNLFKPGVGLTIVGLIILLCIIIVYRSSHPKKQRTEPINWKMIFAWMIGVIGALVMGFGMSKIMSEQLTQSNMLLGLITGMIGLIVCILDYPIYSYLKANKK